MTVENATDPAQAIEASSVAQTDPPAASVPADAAPESATGSEAQPATGESAAPPAASDPPPPARKSAEERIKELIAERNALRSLVAQTPPAKPAAPAPAVTEPEKAPVIEDFDDVNKWVAAYDAFNERRVASLVESGVRTALGKVDSERAQQTTQQQFAQRQEAYARENPDYFETVNDPELQNYVTQTISQVIVETEEGPALSHYLAKNRGDLERIARLQPHQQGVELGKLAVKIATKRQPAPPVKVVQQTKAPAPPTPVGSTTPSKSLEGMPLDEYLANRTWAHRS